MLLLRCSYLALGEVDNQLCTLVIHQVKDVKDQLLLTAEIVVEYQEPRLLTIPFLKVSFIDFLVLKSMCTSHPWSRSNYNRTMAESLPSPTECREDTGS